MNDRDGRIWAGHACRLASLLVLVVCLSALMSSCSYERDVAGDEESAQLARERAERDLAELVAQLETSIGPDVQVKASVVDVWADEDATEDATDPYAGTFRFELWIDGDARPALTRDVNLRSNEAAEGVLLGHGLLLEKETFVSTWFGDITEAPRDQLVPTLEYLAAQDIPSGQSPSFAPMDPVWDNPSLGIIEWQQTLRADCIEAGYPPAECAIFGWGFGDDEVMHLVHFDQDSQEWRLLAEHVGGADDGSFRLLD